MPLHPRIVWAERRYWLGKRREALIIWIVWRLPRELVMWAYIRVAAHATTGAYGSTIVPELTMMEALKRWDEPARPTPPGPPLDPADAVPVKADRP